MFSLFAGVWTGTMNYEPLIGALLILAAVGLLLIWGMSGEPPVAEPGPPPLPKHVYRLRHPKSPDHTVYVALDPDAAARMVTLLQVEDAVGLRSLIEMGLVAEIDPETLVRRIKVGGGLAELRFEDGEHKDALGWTLSKYLSRTPRPVAWTDVPRDG